MIDLRQRRLAGQTLWAFVAEVVRVLASTLIFVLLARTLGPQVFGRYSGVLAVISIGVPFASLGRGHILIMRVSRGVSCTDVEIPTALVVSIAAGISSALVVTVIAATIVHSVPCITIGLIALGEIFGSSLVEVGAQSCQAHDDQMRSTLLRILPFIVRAAAISVIAVSGRLSLESWALVSCGAGVLSSFVVFGYVMARYVDHPRVVPPSLGELGSGLPFSFGVASWELQDDIDKTLLVRDGFVVDAGLYSAGYRVASMAFLPQRAFMVALYPSFFRAGREGAAGTLRRAKRVLPAAVMYSMGAGTLLLLGAGMLPVLLGPGYNSSVSVVRFLAILPVLRGLEFLAGDALTGAGHIRFRAVSTAGLAGLNLGLNLVLIPLYSWRGALAATVIAESLFTVWMWTNLLRFARLPPAE